MPQFAVGDPDLPEGEAMHCSSNESIGYWQSRSEAAEMTVERLVARIRGRDQRIRQLERALARTVSLHNALEDSLEERLEQCIDQRDRQVSSSVTRGAGTDAKDSGAVVYLPHLSRTLSLLFDVMREHWAKWDPERPPKSSTVARAIDTKLGLKGQANGEASRSAQTFAAALRPDSVSENDARHQQR
jgi:hypothetical protein